MKRIIFLCTGNSCRSQMAEGFAKHLLTGENYLIESAGTHPEGLNQIAIKVMRELDINIEGQKSKSVEFINLEMFDVVVTVCDNASKSCFLPSHKRIVQYNFLDPSLSEGTIDEQIVVYRQVRDEIYTMVKELINNYDTICQELN